nr:MAG TPA: hypothetical protein [Caudoviricetes sp.]
MTKDFFFNFATYLITSSYWEYFVGLCSIKYSL